MSDDNDRLPTILRGASESQLDTILNTGTPAQKVASTTESERRNALPSPGFGEEFPYRDAMEASSKAANLAQRTIEKAQSLGVTTASKQREFGASDLLNRAVTAAGPVTAPSRLDTLINQHTQQNAPARSQVGNTLDRGPSTDQDVRAILGLDQAPTVDADLASAAERERYIPTRSVGEFAQDTASSLATGVVDIAGTAYGIANLATGGGIDDLVAANNSEGKVGSQYLEEAKESIRGALDSSKLTAMEKRQQAQAEFRHARNAQDYDNAWQEFGANFVGTLGEYASAPGLAVDAVFDSLPQMFVPGGIAAGLVRKHGAKALAKNLAQQQGFKRNNLAGVNAEGMTRRYLASDAGKAAIGKIQNRTGLSYIAASEGISNGMQIQAEILGSAIEALEESSPRFRTMVAQGKAPEDARKELANEAALITGGISALFGLGAAKVSGAGKLEGQLFDPKSSIGKSLMERVVKNRVTSSQVVKGATSEGVEELIQGGAGEFGGNVGKKLTVDPEQALDEGVADASAQGFAVGSLSGGGVIGAKQTLSAAATGTQKVGKKLKEVATDRAADIKQEKAVIDLVKRADPVELASVRDAESETYDPETALNVMLDPTQMPDQPGQDYVNELNTHYVNAMDKAQTAVVKAMEEDQAGTTSETQAKVRELTNVWKRLQADRAAIDSTLPAEATPEQIKATIAGLAQQTEAAQAQSIASFFGSMDNVTNENLENLKQTGTLSSQQTTAANNRIATNKVMHKALGTKGVNREVIEGTEGNLGYVQYLSRISKAVSNGSRDEAQKYRSMLTTFVAHQNTKAQVFSSALEILSDKNSTKRAAAIASLERVGFKTTEADPHLPAIRGVLKNIQQEIAVGSAIQQETTDSFNAAFKGSAGVEIRTVEESPATATPTVERDVDGFLPKRSVASTTSKPVTPKAEAAISPVEKFASTAVPTLEEAHAIFQKLSPAEQKKLSKASKTLNKKHASEISSLQTPSRKDLGAIQADATSLGRVRSAQPSSETDAPSDLSQSTKETVIESEEAQSTMSTRILTGTAKANSQLNGELVDNMLAEVYVARTARTDNVLQTEEDFFNNFRDPDSDVRARMKEELSPTEFASLQALAAFEKVFVRMLLVGNKGRGRPPTLQDLTKHEAFKRTDPMKLWLQEDINGNKTIDPNMASQMAVAAFQWMGANGATSVTMTPQAINMGLGRRPDEPVSSEEYALFKDLGILKDDVEHSIGSDFMSALNIRPLLSAPEGFHARMVQAAGQVALGTLHELGYMNMNVVTGAQKNDPGLQLTTDGDAASAGAKTYYTRVGTRVGKDGQEPSEQVDYVIRHHKSGNTAGAAVVKKVFDQDVANEHPYSSVEELPKVSNNTTNTNHKNSAAQKRAVDKHQRVKHSLKQTIWKALDGFSERQVQRMAGFEGDLENKNVNERDSISAKNNKIVRDLKSAQEYRDTLAGAPGGLGTVFYYAHEIWKNLRMGMKGNAVNIQNSKVARSLFGVQRHEIETSVSDGPQLDRFLLAAAEAMGIKLLNTDANSIQELRDLLSDANVKPSEPLIAPGLRALVRKQAGETLTKDGNLAVVAAVQAGGQNLHSFEALVALAAWQTAEANGEKTFSHSLSREVDGVNNGVVLAILQMMPDLPFDQVEKLLNRGGIFFDRTYESYADWKQNSLDSDDLYEIVAKHWKQAFTSMHAGMSRLRDEDVQWRPDRGDMSLQANLNRFASLYTGNGNAGQQAQKAMIHLSAFVGEADRDLAKDPLMTFVYGAGLPKISEKLTKISIGKMYSDISKALKDIRNSNEDLVEQQRITQRGIDKLASMERTLSGLLKGPVELNSDTALGFTLSKADIKWLTTNVELAYGSTLDSAFNAEFAPLRERRDSVNKALKNMYVMYKAVFDNRVKEKAAELGRPLTAEEEAGIEFDTLELSPLFKSPMVSDSETNSGINPTGNINQKQGSETDKVNQAYSYLSGEGKLPKGMPDVGNLTTKQQETLVKKAEDNGFKPKENQYETRTKFLSGKAHAGLSVRGTQKPGINNGEGFRQFVSFARKRIMSDTGVRGPVNAIHSMDGATMAGVMGKFDILNVHDAIFVALDQEQAAVEALNASFVNNAFGYDFPAAVLESLNQTKALFQEELSSTDADLRGTVDALLKDDDSSFDKIAGDIVEFSDSVSRATAARTNILERLQGEGWVAQYNNNTRGHDFATAGNPVSEAQEDSVIDSQNAAAIEDVKKSSSNEFNLESFDGIPGINVSNAENSVNTPIDMFNALENLGNVRETTGHKAYLADLVNNVFEKAIQPFQLKLRSEGDTTQGAIIRREGVRDREVYLVNANQGHAHGLQMSSQETYVHELTHAVIEHGLDSDTSGKREVVRLYRHAKANMKPEAFLPEGLTNPTADELDAAQARWNYIFHNTKSKTQTHINPFNGETETVHRSNHLHEFMTFGLTNAAFMKSLAALPPVPNRIDTKSGILATLFNVFNRILAVFDMSLNRTSGKDAATRLKILAQRFANTEESNVLKVAESLNVSEVINDGFKTGITKFVVDPLVKFANTKVIKENRFGLVREAGGLLTHARHTETAAWGKAIAKARRRQGKTSRNFLDHVVREFIGQTENAKVWHAILALSGKLLDQNHKAVTTNTAKQMLSVFDKLTKAENHGLTKAVLKTDLAAIYNDYTPAQIQKLFKSDGKFLAKEISKLEAQLGGVPADVNSFYLKHVKSTASLMVTGNATEAGTYMNAHNMARAYGVAKTGPADKTGLDISTVELDAVENVLNRLISLEALAITGSQHKAVVATVIEREAAKGSDSGLNFLVDVLNTNRRVSRDRVFNNNKTQMVKGYVVDTMDPDITMKVGRLAERNVMRQNGYILVNDTNARPLPMDPIHMSISPSEPSDRMYLYVNKDSQAAAIQRGALDIKQLTTSGTDLTAVAEQQGDLAAAYTANIESDTLKRKLKEGAKRVASTRDTAAKPDENFLVPVFTDTGEISGFRYTMSERNKDVILNRDNSFETVVGNMEASIEDKVNGRHINEKIVAELKKEFDAGFKRNRDEFVFVGESSTGDFQEMWQMMPASARRNVEATFGEKGMWIRDDIVELVFGRRKFSLLELTNKFATSKAHKLALENLGLDLAKYLNITVGRVENVWQSIIKTVKDTIVIRTISVLVNNVISNINLLVMHQVNPIALTRNHVIAFKRAKEYRIGLEKVAKAKFEIRAKKERLSTNLTAPEKARLQKEIDALDNRVTEINEELATNPVRELNEAGVYQTIVEDVEQEDNQFSYASKIENWASPVVSKVPDSIKTVGKHLFMAHDTPVYKFLRDATQLSDFVARYTLHEHNLKKGMSKKDSIHHVVRSFINYDLPTHRYVQYANDIGLIMFTKFAFRVQRVILESAKGNPANVLALLMLQDIFGDAADITDSVLTPGGVIDRLNLNPLALMATGLTEGATINHLVG